MPKVVTRPGTDGSRQTFAVSSTGQKTLVSTMSAEDIEAKKKEILTLRNNIVKKYPNIPRINKLSASSGILGIDFDSVIFIGKYGQPVTVEEMFGVAAASDTSNPYYNSIATRSNDPKTQATINDTIRSSANEIFNSPDAVNFTDDDIISIITEAVSTTCFIIDSELKKEEIKVGGGRKYKQRGGNWFAAALTSMGEAFRATLNLSMTIISFIWGMIKYPFTAGTTKLANLRTTHAIITMLNDPANNVIDRADAFLATKIPELPGLIMQGATTAATTIGNYLSSLDSYDWSLLFLMGIYTYGGTPILINGITWALSYAPGGLLPGFLGEGIIVKMLDVFLTYKVGTYGFKFLKFIVQKGVKGCLRIYNAGEQIVAALEDRFAGVTEAQLQTAGNAFDTKLQDLLARISGQDGQAIGTQIPVVVAELNAAANTGVVVEEAPIVTVQRRQRQITAYLRTRASSTSASSSTSNAASISTSNAASSSGQGGGRRRSRKHRSRRANHRKSIRSTHRKHRKSGRQHR